MTLASTPRIFGPRLALWRAPAVFPLCPLTAKFFSTSASIPMTPFAKAPTAEIVQLNALRDASEFIKSHFLTCSPALVGNRDRGPRPLPSFSSLHLLSNPSSITECASESNLNRARSSKVRSLAFPDGRRVAISSRSFRRFGEQRPTAQKKRTCGEITSFPSTAQPVKQLKKTLLRRRTTGQRNLKHKVTLIAYRRGRSCNKAANPSMTASSS